MEIDTSSAFERHYRKLPRNIKEQTKRKEIIFRDNPFHPSLKTHKLHGKDKEHWAFSVDRKYRIKFLFLSSTHVLFVDVGLHDIYS